ncbi:PREDICTED: mite allergen Der f 3-like [Priapulus caudatus]|uniref:Mite allergen Der f 3-like n=1 Tax=Priapulus caudatus TaxID=37621 RepID=A0ABM1DN86_PRICU|nr:PREDICTED: mite allergen Der f 3-like [Priapulus caudatus]
MDAMLWISLLLLVFPSYIIAQEVTSTATTTRATQDVVNGREAVPHEFPWMAVIETPNFEGITCGGAIIDECHVITARHCVGKLTSEDVTVKLGKHSIQIAEVTEQTFSVDGMNVHPTFDVALVRLNTAAILNENIKPIDMDAWTSAKVGDDIIVAGWGVYNSTQLLYASNLQKISLTVVDPNTCEQDGIVISDIEWCAGELNAATYSNACYGDSGSPALLRRADSSYVLAGLVERGLHNCPLNHRYAAYTNTTLVIDWVRKRTSGVLLTVENNEYVCRRSGGDDNDVEFSDVNVFNRVGAFSAGGGSVDNATTTTPPTTTTTMASTARRTESRGTTATTTQAPTQPTTTRRGRGHRGGGNRRTNRGRGNRRT